MKHLRSNSAGNSSQHPTAASFSSSSSANSSLSREGSFSSSSNDASSSLFSDHFSSSLTSSITNQMHLAHYPSSRQNSLHSANPLHDDDERSHDFASIMSDGFLSPPQHWSSSSFVNHQRSSSESEYFSPSTQSSAHQKQNLLTSPKKRRFRSGSFSSIINALGKNAHKVDPDATKQTDSQNEEEPTDAKRKISRPMSPPPALGSLHHDERIGDKVSLQAHLTTNSNYRQSVSFTKQQYHLYKLFLIGHTQSHSGATSGVTTSSSTEYTTKQEPTPDGHSFGSTLSQTLGSKGKYTTYLVEVHHMDRSILVHRRYSEFFHLYKYLKSNYPSYPFSIPPKKIVGNMSTQTIEKRKQGLKRFLWEVKQICGFKPTMDESSTIPSKGYAYTESKESQPMRSRGESKNALPHQPYMWYQDPVIQKFFCLKEFDENRIYRLTESVWINIFKFLGFNDLYRNVSLTSKWMTRILYNRTKETSFSYVNEDVFFQNTPIAVDTNEELLDLIIRFAGATSLSLCRFHGINNSFVETIVRHKVSRLKKINIRNCSLKGTLDFSKIGPRLERVSITYAPRLKNVLFNQTMPQCQFLDLSHTALSDTNLENIVSFFPRLETLILKGCDCLKSPTLGGDRDSASCKRLRILNFAQCSQLEELTLVDCRNLENLCVDFTSIQNDALQGIFDSCKKHLKKLCANSCQNIESLTVVDTALEHLEFSCCMNIDMEKWTLSSENLKWIDFRLGNVQLSHLEKAAAKTAASCQILYCDELVAPKPENEQHTQNDETT